MKKAILMTLFLMFALMFSLGSSCSSGGDNNNNGDDDAADDDTADDDDSQQDCADQGNLGTAKGKTMADFSLTDENGDSLNLYDLCDKVVLVVSSAGWCPACAQEASNIAAELYEPYHDQGLEIFYTIFEDSDGNAPSEAYLKSFISVYDLPFDVYADPTGILFDYQDTYPTIYTPFNILLDKNMVIRQKIAGWYVGTLKYYIEILLEELGGK